MQWLTDLLTKWKEMITVVAVIIGGLWSFGWFVIEPRAQAFIQETVDDQITDLNKRLADLQLSMDSQKSVDSISQTRLESDLASTKALLQQILESELRRSQSP